MAQDKNTTIPIEALADSLNKQAKPILILLSTDWCRYCRMQKIQLEKNQDFQAAKNNFYFVEFNAETKDSILFNEKIYYYKSSGLSTGIHELAIELGNQKEGISYPLWIILDKYYEVLLRQNGLLAGDDLKKIIEALSKDKR
jgi:thioredoxin-related protein